MFYKFLIFLFSLFTFFAFVSALFSLIWWGKWDVFAGSICGGIFFLAIIMIIKRLEKKFIK